MLSAECYFITGASGVGKTTLVSALKERHANKPWGFFHFDSIGVPSVAEMHEKFGSPSAWQKAKTEEWIEKILSEHNVEKIFLEGQVNLEFIREAFENHGVNNYTIVLIDCSESEMRSRLIHNRKQPHLFNVNMKNWLKFLRLQAQQYGAIIIDSSTMSVEEMLNEFERAVIKK